MPEQRTREAASKDKREGKSASTQVGEYVHEAIEHVKKGKHGARSAKQAIAIGLSEARRDGVKAPVSKTASKSMKEKAAQGSRSAEHPRKPSATRSKATTKALKKEGRSAVSKKSLSAQAKQASSKRSASARSASAKKAAATTGAAGRATAAKKAAKTRKRAE